MNDPIRNYTPTKLDIVKKWACATLLQLDEYSRKPNARKTILVPIDQLFDFAEASKENTPRADEELHKNLDGLRRAAMMSEREDKCASVVIEDLQRAASGVLRYGAH